MKVGDRVVLILDNVEGVIARVSRPGWFMVRLDGYEDRIEFQASELRVLSGQPALTENDDAALQAHGWTITTHTRKTGGQAGGTYQTWLPPRGRKALRSRVEVRRYLASQQRSAPPTPAAALPPGVERLLASDAFQLAAAFSGPRGLGALAAAGRALRRVDWAPAWRDLLEARFQLGPFHERTGLELACRRALDEANNDSWAPLAILAEYLEDATQYGAPRDARGTYRLADSACPILWRGPANVDRSVVPMAGVAADGRFLPAAQALGVRFYFGEPFSRRRRFMRFRFTADRGPSGGLMNCAYVGLCVRDVADDAARQVQELDATFISSFGFGYGATLEGGSTSYGFSAADAVDLGLEWNARGEISASCDFTYADGERRVHRWNLRRLLRRDAGEVGLVPVVGVPLGAKAMIGSGRCFFDDIMKEEFKDTMRRHSVPVPGDAAPAADGSDDAELGDGAGAGNAGGNLEEDGTQDDIAPSPAPAAAVDLTAGADFVVPPVRQSYTLRAPDDDAVPPHR